MTDMVTLRNGYVTPRVGLAITIISVELLFKEDQIALYDLVMACRNPQHQMFPGTERVLLALTLAGYVDATGGVRIHERTRNVVLSMVEGDELEMHLVHPIVS